MKFKRIASLCNKAKNYVLYDKQDSTGGNTQWLGDGCAAYPLDGLPQLDEDSLCKMFDITEKKKGSMLISRRAWDKRVSADDTDPNETMADEMDLGLTQKGRELIPLIGRDGIIFIHSKYISPLEDEMEMLQMYERKTDTGQTYIAIKAGLLIRAVIFPIEPAYDKLVSQLHDIIRECKRAMQRPHVCGGVSEADDGPQITWIKLDE